MYNTSHGDKSYENKESRIKELMIAGTYEFDRAVRESVLKGI